MIAYRDVRYKSLTILCEKYLCATIMVLDGGGYKKGAEKWLRAAWEASLAVAGRQRDWRAPQFFAGKKLREQVDDKLIHIFNMMEFQKWSNSEEL